jgi:nucleotide-binding universal stress UspA family protein
MLRRILVPLDGSPFAEIAVPVAEYWCAAAGAELRLVHVREPILSVVPSPEGALLAPSDDEARRAASVAYLNDLASRGRSAKQIQIATEVIDGWTGPTLTERIASWRADLVVMATHGRGPFARAWLGSVADYLLRHASAPMLLLRPKDDADWPPPDLNLRSVLVPIDLSPASEAILESVVDLANLHRARIELVFVLESVLAVPSPLAPVGPSHFSMDQGARELAERHLAAVAERVRSKGVEVTTSVIAGAGVAATLVDLIQDGPCDLVALTTHGRGGLQRALLGSVADKLIRATRKPVLVLRPPQ